MTSGSPSRRVRCGRAWRMVSSAGAPRGRPYSFRGTVIPGDQRGRTIGYPTMNIQLVPGRKLLPPEGVYAVRAQTARGNFGGMMNLGPRPTFGDSKSTVEVHLFGVDGDWYHESVSVELVRRLRDTV